ncbi:hypothetical protein K3495_g7095 [Podosphaera aphanis]|nr:hypothetical protein K3495_g7095 [Podosphaera aphanis]
MPRSLPELSSSKSSKSSSFHSSYQSDDNTILTYFGNFEEIGLEDEHTGEFAVKPATSFLEAHYVNDYRLSVNEWWKSSFYANEKKNLSDLTIDKAKKPFPESITHIAANVKARRMNLTPDYSPSIRFTPSLSQISPPKKNAIPNTQRCKSPSMISSVHTKRSMWQVNRERKTVQELEKEFDEDSGEDVPDECFLDNIPLSPRMMSRWTKNLSIPTPKCPDRPARDKEKFQENLTSLNEENAARLSSSLIPKTIHIPASPDYFKARPKGWTDALSDLGMETKKLTEDLEIFHEESKKTGALFSSENSVSKSARTALPPIRKIDIMIDPLPISREKEAVLSRTRPSWLPPKNPAEERRHVKEYQQMMAQSLEADRKKEAEKREKSADRDDTAKSLLRLWEERVLPNWEYSIRQKQTRELWWKGVAPRCRGNVWRNAIGNELGLTEMSYTAALQRAKALEKAAHCKLPLAPDEERKMNLLGRISYDVALTYPELRIFQPKGPLHAPLLDILKAYTMYRSDIGYVHGISNCAALLLLNLPTPAAAFIALSNLLNRPLPLSFHTSDTEASQRAFSLLFSTLMNKSPKLHAHFQTSSSISSREMVFKDFFTSMGTTYMNLDNATRLWDIMLFEGDCVLVRAAAAFLMNIEGKLFGADTPEKIMEITKESPLDIAEEEWVDSIRRTY